MLLQGFDDAQFVFWCDPGEHVDVLDVALQLRRAHALQFGSRDDPAGLQQAQFDGNGPSRFRMVAGDHDRADASGLTNGNGLSRFRPRWILNADEA